MLPLTFAGQLTTDDLNAIDPLIVGLTAGRNGVSDGVRILYDMTAIEALAVPSSRFAERAGLAPIGKLMRVAVAPPWANATNFGPSHRDGQSLHTHPQPILVLTLPDAYRLLSLVDPHFEPFDHLYS